MGKWREKGDQRKASETPCGICRVALRLSLMGIGVIGGLIHGIRDGRLRPAALHDMIADRLILPVCIVQLVLLCGS